MLELTKENEELGVHEPINFSDFLEIFSSIRQIYFIRLEKEVSAIVDYQLAMLRHAKYFNYFIEAEFS